MNFDDFCKLPQAKRFNQQRCIYLIRPTTSKYFGVAAKWIKVGQAKCGLFNRLRAYRTGWPMGITVIAVATVAQPEDLEKSTIYEVEKTICDSPVIAKSRIRNTESFMDSTRVRSFILSSLLNHKHVLQVWSAPGNGPLKST